MQSVRWLSSGKEQKGKHTASGENGAVCRAKDTAGNLLKSLAESPAVKWLKRENL